MNTKPFALPPEDRRAYEKLPFAFCLLRVLGDFCDTVAVSDGFCGMFRVRRQELPSDFLRAAESRVHPDDREKLRTELEVACLRPGGEYQGVYRVASDDSAYLWVSCCGRIEPSDDGARLLYLWFRNVDDEMERRLEAESEKHRQDVLFANILATTQTAIFWKDADRRFLGANRAFLDYYGFPDDSVLLGHNDEEMGWHTEPDPYRNDELRVLRDGASTYRVRGKCLARGENRDIVASKSPLRIGGKIVGLVGSFEDVTNEVRQREEIARLNAELEKRVDDHDRLMNISDVCIVKIRLEDFTFLEYNDAMCRMIGYSRAEYEAQYHHRMEEFFTGEYRTDLRNLRAAAEKALGEGGQTFTINMRVPTRTGFVWISGAASFAEYDPETHRPACLFAVYRDISEVLEAREKLAQAAMLASRNEEMRRMIDGVPSGVGALHIVKGVPEKNIQMNRYFVERVDMAQTGNGLVDLRAFLAGLYSDDRARCREDFETFLKVKEPMQRQYRFRSRRTGAYYWVGVRGTVQRLDADAEIAYFTYTDIDESKKTEMELRESRRFYREVIQAAKLSTWEYDIPSHTIHMSDDEHTAASRTILDMPRDIPNLPDSLAGSISPEDRPTFLQMYREVEEGKNASCEVWYEPENGREPRCERITYLAAGEPGEKPTRAIGFTQNITAEKKVEERYQREIGYLRQTDDNKLVAKGHFNLTRNTVLEYSTKNDSFFRLTPGTAYDDAFRAFREILYVDSERREIADRLDKGNLARRYQKGDMQTSVLYRRARKAQLPLWISMNIHTYMMPETGDLECFTYAYDVTEKMENDEIMGRISDAEFDYIGLIFVGTNQIRILKKSAEIRFPEIQKMTDFDACCDYVRRNCVQEDERAQFDSAVSLKTITAALKGKDRYVASYRRTQDGRTLYKQMDYVWMDREAEVLLVVRSDVTDAFDRDRKQLAQIEAAKLEADKANEAKSVFLSSMSHDMRTPLNGVIGFTSLALKENDLEKKQDYLKKIESSGKLLLDLVNDTLELSRIESGKSTLEPEAVMPNDLIPAVVTALRPSALLKGVRLETDFSAQMDTPVWCDRLKVQKIALNLISNAIKYTPEGGTVSVRLRPSASQPPDIQCSLIVEDNGIGMSEEFLRRMYEPFAQERRSESVKIPGTGLGLSIVKRYVDLMGGTISVESHIHKGTRFVVDLPVQAVREGQAMKRKAAAVTCSFAGKRVLLCEDNYMNTEIAAVLLRDKGFFVETAENGQEGLDRFAASAPGYYDAVLMDIRMPVMDGYEATRRIRKLSRPDAGSVPIIAMSADAFQESIRAAETAGMNDYVTKPVEPDRLYGTLSSAIGGGAK